MKNNHLVWRNQFGDLSVFSYICSMKRQSILWSVLSKYDGHADFTKFCDSISRFIQNNVTGDDFITVYQHLNTIDREDYNKVNEAIGGDIDNYFFTV